MTNPAMTPGTPEVDPNPLITLLRECVVRIECEGRFRGSAFFTAPGRVLTCAHVVHGGQDLKAVWQGRSAAVTAVVAAPPLASVANPERYPLPDLAVLDLGDGADDWGHPCVRLSVAQPALAMPAERLYLAGYTIEHRADVPALTGLATELESLVTEDGRTFYKLARGQVAPGFSGSPLLDRRAGSVVAVVESSRGIRADLGGFAVPVQLAEAAFAGVLAANEAFHRTDGRWQAAVDAERVLAAPRRRLVLRPAVVPLPPGPDVSAAKILRPRYAVVGYVGREQLLSDIATWRAEGDRGVGVWFVTGGGGFGKTRLAIEACVRAGAEGWTAGLLPRPAREDDLTALADWPGKLLIAIDYAETQPAVVERLVEELTARPDRPAARILLLVRRRAARAELLTLFNESEDEELDAVLRGASSCRLDEADAEVDRLELFDRAVRDFAFAGAAAEPPLRPRLRAAHFDRPLYVLTAALLCGGPDGFDVDALSEEELLRALLTEHESHYWARWDGRRRLGLDPADQRAAVAVATLLGAADLTEALAVARLVPHHGGETEARLIAIARWLAQLYPSGPGTDAAAINPLEPDRLGEVLVGDVLHEHPGLLAAALDAASDRQRVRALTVAVRIARDDDAMRDQLRTVLDERLGDLVAGLYPAGQDEAVPALLDALTVARPVAGARQAVRRLSEPVPSWLWPLILRIAEIAVQGLRDRADTDPDALIELSALLIVLSSIPGGDTGNPEAPLAAAAEAVDIYRKLAETDNVGRQPELGGALTLLSLRLGEAGQQAEALAAAREAVTINRQLASAIPDRFGLAAALTSLTEQLSRAGQRDEALAAAEEAVSIWRELSPTDPARLTGLGEALILLGVRLFETGHHDEALAAAEEAVGILGELAAGDADPLFHLPSLGRALNSLGVYLDAAGRPGEALAAAEEAVRVLGPLADVKPVTKMLDLAVALTNLGARLSDAGRADEALSFAGGAATMYRDLADASPAHLPGLATALNLEGGTLSRAGRWPDALAVFEEAVGISRELAEASPDAHLPGLAKTLANLSRVFAECGRIDDALSAAREATVLRRQLAGAYPDAHLPELARALESLGERLSEAGHPAEALTAAREAVTTYRQLADANPAAHLPGLALAVGSLARRLSETGHPAEALTAAREAVTTYRQLADANPAAHLPGLAAAVGSLARRLSETGHPAEALTAAREAVTTYRQLADANPVYLPRLEGALSRLADYLADAGDDDEADSIFEDVLRQFEASPEGRGPVLSARGSWRADRNRLADAVADLAAAVTALDEAGDRSSRGRVRYRLRELRAEDPMVFDKAWNQPDTPLPPWLRYPVTDADLDERVRAWLTTPDWPDSRVYLEHHAPELLTDRAEAALEHLIDAAPDLDLDPFLALLRTATAKGISAAYTQWEEDERRARLATAIGSWLAAENQEESQAIAVSSAADLLDPATLALLEQAADQNLADQRFRLHRGLLGIAAVAGFDAAYALATTPGGEPPEGCELPAARVRSGLLADDAEAHFELAIAALTAGRLHEAAAALADCAANAAPFERRDFARRLRRHATGNPDLGGLLEILEGSQAPSAPQ
jgi:tetratricopeptide (TPR) repeat protein